MSHPAPAATAPAAVHPGTWKLPTGRAMSLRPGKAFVLSVAQGRLWATVDGRSGGSPADLGDQVMEAGDRLAVAPGRHLVIESWGGAACFAWDPAPLAAAEPVRARAAIAEPLADLRHALGLALGAAGRLAAALAGWPAPGRPDNRGHGATPVFPA